MVRVLLGMKTWQVERSQSIRSEIFETTGDDDKVGIPGIHEKFHWLVFLQNWRHNLLCRPQQHHLRRGVLSFVLKKSGRKISLITMDIVSGPLPCYCYRVSVCLLLWHCDNNKTLNNGVLFVSVPILETSPFLSSTVYSWPLMIGLLMHGPYPSSGFWDLSVITRIIRKWMERKDGHCEPSVSQ